jgi:hypothetical protein
VSSTAIPSELAAPVHGPAAPAAILGFISRLAGHGAALSDGLGYWSRRRTDGPDAGARRSANMAMDAIDGMLLELYTLRGCLVSEIRASDDDAAARVDELLARRRAQVPAGPEARAFR